MARFRVGVQLHPQVATVDELRFAWRAADALGVDSIWVWDHFFPLYGNPDANHYEAYSLLAAMAAETTTPSSARSSRATRTATRSCSPTWRARST